VEGKKKEKDHPRRGLTSPTGLESGLNLAEAQRLAQNRRQWKELIVYSTVYSPRDEKGETKI